MIDTTSHQFWTPLSVALCLFGVYIIGLALSLCVLWTEPAFIISTYHNLSTSSMISIESAYHTLSTFSNSSTVALTSIYDNLATYCMIYFTSIYHTLSAYSNASIFAITTIYDNPYYIGWIFYRIGSSKIYWALCIIDILFAAEG